MEIEVALLRMMTRALGERTRSGLSHGGASSRMETRELSVAGSRVSDPA